MRTLLIYYTGTYNTRYLTDMAENALKSRGHDVTRIEVRRDAPVIDTDGFDLVGIGYPIYGFNSPLPLNRYIKKLRFRKGQRYFIYKNSGETFAINNASDRVIKRRMRRRGATLVGQYHFVMPYNIHFPFDRDFIRELLDKDKKLLEVMMHDLESGNIAKIKSNIFYDIASAVVSVQKIGGFVNSFFYRVDADKCVGCMRCVRECPEQNISVRKGKIVFGHRCDMCMRCSFYCPSDAIKTGFLEGWKVREYYDLGELAAEGPPTEPYITERSRGFYKCYIRTFADIERRYAETKKAEASEQSGGMPMSDAPANGAGSDEENNEEG